MLVWPPQESAPDLIGQSLFVLMTSDEMGSVLGSFQMEHGRRDEVGKVGIRC